jgi:putative membrane protein
MTIRWLFAAFHLIALGLGLGAVWMRGRALRGPLDRAGLTRVFAADNAWGVAAGLWLVTGLVRLLSTMEKGRSYYFHNSFFMLKMTLFGGILLLELAPMIALIRWRVASRRGEAVDTSRANLFARISVLEAVLVLVMVFAATAMARGLGAIP